MLLSLLSPAFCKNPSTIFKSPRVRLLFREPTFELRNLFLKFRLRHSILEVEQYFTSKYHGALIQLLLFLGISPLD